MSVNLTFKFPLSLLTQESDYILDAAEAHAAAVNPRLPANFVANQRTLLTTVRSAASTQKTKTATIGGLTISQDQAITALNDLVSRAKDSAKRAFKGQDVKLRNDFQVGINSPGDLASVLHRARIVRDASANVENASLLATKGWLATDTTALTNAVDGLDTTDDTQETAKADKTGSTDSRNTAANNLYEGLLTVQNAANIQWPDRDTANSVVRAEFRLGLFPPRSTKKVTPPTPAPTPA